MATPLPPVPESYPARRHYQQDSVAADYDRRRFANPFGRGSDRLEKRALRRALAHLPGRALILELACGTGRMTEVAVRSGRRVVGLDISQAMLRGAVQRLGTDPQLLGLLRGQSESIPLRTASVHAVMAYRFLPHLPEPSRRVVFAEIGRVTQRFAVLQFSTPRSLLFWLRRVREALTGKRKRRGITRAQLLAELGVAGFREVATFGALPGIGETNVVVIEKTTALPGA